MAHSGSPHFPVNLDDKEFYPTSESSRWVYYGGCDGTRVIPANPEQLKAIDEAQSKWTGRPIYTKSYLSRNKKKRAKELGLRVVA